MILGGAPRVRTLVERQVVDDVERGTELDFDGATGANGPQAAASESM
jgi:hypothetical protein